jgi:hypothetical protein
VKTASPSNAFLRDSFELSLCMSVTVYLTVMWWTGTHVRCQHRGSQRQWENNMSFPGEEEPRMRLVRKDGEPVGRLELRSPIGPFPGLCQLYIWIQI